MYPTHSAPEVETPACVGCGGTDVKDLYAVCDRRYEVPGSFRMVECTACQLRFVSPRPTASAIAAYYPDSYPAHQKRGAGGDGGFFSRVWDGYQRMFLSHAYPTFYYRKHIDRFRTDGDPPRVLDVGCGSGQKLQYLRNAGWDPHGVDFSRMAVDNARASGIAKAVVSDSSEIPFESNHIHAAMSWHSIEHHYDPVATLREIHRVLRPGGRAILAIPGSDSLGMRVFRSYWGPLEVPRHLYHFTRKTFTDLTSRVGFNTLKVYYDFSFYGLFWDQEVLESFENLFRARGVKFRFPRIPGMSVAMRVPVLPLNPLLGRFWQGSNMIVHLQKPAE